VDQVSFAVQHDVAVVSVFDLQQEQQEAVGGHAADEVIPSLEEEEEEEEDDDDDDPFEHPTLTHKTKRDQTK